MKKVTCMLAAMAFLTVGPAGAQGSRHLRHTRAYVRLGLGYAFPHAGAIDFNGYGVNGSSSTLSTAGTASNQINLKKYSFGTGLNGTVAAGIMLHRNVGVELGITGILAPKKYHFVHTNASTGSSQQYDETTYYNGAAALIPALVLNLPTSMFDLYTRLGLVIPVSGKVFIDEEVTSRTGTGSSVDEYRTEYKNFFSLGVAGALGIKYHLNNRIGLWAELNGSSRSAFIKRSDLTRFTRDGINRLQDVYQYDKVTEFDYDYTNTGATPNLNAPRQDVTSSAPYSDFGFAVGVVFGF